MAVRSSQADNNENRMFAFGRIPAAAEGLALYAERFAAEDGWYDGDAAGRLGQLSDALLRARRLERARAELGEHFAIRDFHRAVSAALAELAARFRARVLLPGS